MQLHEWNRSNKKTYRERIIIIHVVVLISGCLQWLTLGTNCFLSLPVFISLCYHVGESFLYICCMLAMERIVDLPITGLFVEHFPLAVSDGFLCLTSTDSCDKWTGSEGKKKTPGMETLSASQQQFLLANLQL